ncbi:ferredoxin [Actinomadura craniellae]|uniref:Ferredoxin n=1 Tax=Actinomadura craniellae TaxID=2231787 RepID=A0A365GX68_9ACTN|nr:ferredoxin [Actinomadura craniellae]RAY11358.1 ferredoxin [Actinomadura craniellae]
MRVRIDPERCRGAGQCAFTAPEVFDQDEDTGLVVLLLAEPPDTARPAVERAAAACPNRVIDLR